MIMRFMMSPAVFAAFWILFPYASPPTRPFRCLAPGFARPGYGFRSHNGTSGYVNPGSRWLAALWIAVLIQRVEVFVVYGHAVEGGNPTSRRRSPIQLSGHEIDRDARGSIDAKE